MVACRYPYGTQRRLNAKKQLGRILTELTTRYVVLGGQSETNSGSKSRSVP
ncbi:MAG: hypothetical protein K0Q90_1751 [Paenibacillaceae bacterium]|jgi:hypothetical protein|nr:hypothetical protein [Paenibacillaceae bacterium]